MAKRHSMTPARRAALKKAQIASARKRRGKGKGKLAAANRQLGPRKQKGMRYGTVRGSGKRALMGAGAAAGVVLGAHAIAAIGSKRDSIRRNRRANAEYEDMVSDILRRERLQGYRQNMGRHRSKTHGLPYGKSRAGRTNSRYVGITIDSYGRPGF